MIGCSKQDLPEVFQVLCDIIGRLSKSIFWFILLNYFYFILNSFVY